jgi:hypothetical protein
VRLRLSLELTLSVAAAGGCATRIRPAISDQPAIARDTCAHVDGLDPLLHRGQIVFFGEIHGTTEAPAFVGDVMCAATRRRLPIILGLELPTEMAPMLSKFSHSRGDPGDRETLLADPFWHETFQDGRRSQAMFDLISRVHELVSQGADIVLLPFSSELSASGPRNGQERDRAMAATLITAFSRSPNVLGIVLAGDIHTRVSRGTPFDSAYASMAYLAYSQLGSDRIVAIDIAHDGGTAWICITAAPSDCGARNLRPQSGATRGAIVRRQTVLANGHQGWFGLGTITASPPAAR